MNAGEGGILGEGNWGIGGAAIPGACGGGPTGEGSKPPCIGGCRDVSRSELSRYRM